MKCFIAKRRQKVFSEKRTRKTGAQMSQRRNAEPLTKIFFKAIDLAALRGAGAL
jgi:hypothetical protein